jgi:multicomponent Na+:H+ antiporter subunit E
VTGLLWNISLALAWTAITGDFTLGNLGMGFALGFIIMFFARRVIGGGYTSRMFRIVELFIFFCWELLLANFRVAFDVLTPKDLATPGIIALPLDVQSDVEITLLANMITLTPGTVTLDVSADRKVLYVHAMYIDEGDIEGFRRRIKHGFERRIIEALRERAN